MRQKIVVLMGAKYFLLSWRGCRATSAISGIVTGCCLLRAQPGQPFSSVYHQRISRAYFRFKAGLPTRQRGRLPSRPTSPTFSPQNFLIFITYTYKQLCPQLSASWPGLTEELQFQDQLFRFILFIIEGSVNQPLLLLEIHLTGNLFHQ